MHDLDSRAGTDRPFDVDGRRLVERDLDTEVVRQRRLDDLLLHLAVERDGDLLPETVLPQVDQRVLLGELGERGVQRGSVGGPADGDDRLGQQTAVRTAIGLSAGHGGVCGFDPDPLRVDLPVQLRDDVAVLRPALNGDLGEEHGDHRFKSEAAQTTVARGGT